MLRAHLIVKNSEGIQEEAPSLSKPVLVTRNETERPEAIAAGTALLVGTSEEGLFEAMSTLLDNAAVYNKMAAKMNPFGDGRASERIVASLVSAHSREGA